MLGLGLGAGVGRGATWWSTWWPSARDEQPERACVETLDVAAQGGRSG
jgi:hypothetical protein